MDHSQDHHHHHQAQDHRHSNNSSERPSHTEPVRSRWTPKPEQILILESIFNSGMVNPPKDETVRIRKMLEKFGAVGDANVFYWFQNRRSRSRRRQRQLQAAEKDSLNHTAQACPVAGGGVGSGGGAIQYNDHAGASLGFDCNFPYNFGSSSRSCFQPHPSSSSCGEVVPERYQNFNMGHENAVENLFTVSGSQIGFQEIEPSSNHAASILCSSGHQSPNFDQYHPGFITVFINGVPAEVPRGTIDMKSMFGEDVFLVHSSGIPLPINDFGFLVQSLQHGEAYFLVPRQG